MGLRLSPKEAADRGLISLADAKEMELQARQRRHTHPARPPSSPQTEAKPSLSPAAAKLAAEKKADLEIPQRLLFEALCIQIPGIPEWEREGLIPGRKFRADIYIPPSIVVEMDGFKFHRTKDAFQKDRMRANIFTMMGFRVFRAFTKQCLDEGMRNDLVKMIVQAYETPVYLNDCKGG